MRWIGIDLGEKRIGVAVSDPFGKIAMPLRIILRTNITQEIATLLEEYPNVDGFVLGFPKTLRGEVGKNAQDAQTFAEWLRTETKKEVVLWDERLSTRAVQERRDRKSLDAHAAQFFLQGFLDSRQKKAAVEPA